MALKKAHFISGIVITCFIGVHLINHLISLWGAEAHIQFMNSLRIVYRNIFVELILLLAVSTQVVSGTKLFIRKRKSATNFFDKLQIFTGLYLAGFFIIHLSAVLIGRTLMQLDTNFYFGVAGLNSFPINLFFIPYYSLAIFSFFGHIAAIHSKKMKPRFLGLSPNSQAKFIIVLGLLVTVVTLYGLTNHFTGVELPEEYLPLTGKGILE